MSECFECGSKGTKVFAYRSDALGVDTVTLGVQFDEGSTAVRLTPEAARKLAAELLKTADEVATAAKAASARVEEAITGRDQ